MCPGHYLPVHLYLLAEMGTRLLEMMCLEELARDSVYEFAFFGAPAASPRIDWLTAPPLGDASAVVGTCPPAVPP